MISAKKHFYIDSRSRIEGTDCNFSYSIPIPKDDQYTHVVVLDCVIPKSYYLIRAGKNTFTMIENDISRTVTIPVGNYSRRSFQSVLQTCLNSASSQGWTYVVSYPTTTTAADTGKYTYTVSNNGGLQPSFVFTTNVFEALGFNQNTTYTFVGDTLESANVIKLQGEDQLYLHSDIANNGSDSILQEIYAASSVTFGNIVYQCPDPIANAKLLTTQANNMYRFSLTDETNQNIELNGLNICFTIMVFKMDNLFGLMKEYIKYVVQRK